MNRIVNGRPILLADVNEVFRPPDYYVPSSKNPMRVWTRWARAAIPSPSVNLSFDREIPKFVKAVVELGGGYILVVGCGRTKERLEAKVSGSGLILIFTDIDVWSDADFIADAQSLPFADGTFSGVITTAVLEHVLDPQRAVSEIARVTRAGGLVYSELPFLQGVHEGAYDFFRYTLSGHRRLFHWFDELHAGTTAGPGTSLVWAIEGLVVALTPTWAGGVARAVCRVLVSWIKYFDILIRDAPAALDGASCTFFLGRKRNGESISDRHIIEAYRGRRHLSHL